MPGLGETHLELREERPEKQQMSVDRTNLARYVGSLDEYDEHGGTLLAQLALERILGEANIRHAVELILDARPGAELAMNVLRHIMAWQATEMAYHAYKTATGERAAQAVWLIKHLAHPQSQGWIREFLLDDNVAVWG